jgi:hypothetical protein
MTRRYHTPAIAHLIDGWDGGDPWGSAMSAGWAVAEVARAAAVPGVDSALEISWGYGPAIDLGEAADSWTTGTAMATCPLRPPFCRPHTCPVTSRTTTSSSRLVCCRAISTFASLPDLTTDRPTQTGGFIMTAPHTRNVTRLFRQASAEDVSAGRDWYARASRLAAELAESLPRRMAPWRREPRGGSHRRPVAAALLVANVRARVTSTRPLQPSTGTRTAPRTIAPRAWLTRSEDCLRTARRQHAY